MKKFCDLFHVDKEKSKRDEDESRVKEQEVILEEVDGEEISLAGNQSWKQKKKNKKHFLYKNGKVRYVNLFSGGVKDGLTVAIKKTDKSTVLKYISMVILISSLVPLLFSMKDGLHFNPLTGEKDGPSIEDSYKSNPNDTDTSPKSAKEIMEGIQSSNTREIDKVMKYLEIKGNRISTMAEIKKAKKEKEALYLTLLSSKGKMTDSEFLTTESLIVKSVGMSKELLTAFEGNLSNDTIQDIISKYTKGGN